MTDYLFDETSIRASFVAVATRLEALDEPPGLLIVVGGSFMALHGLRDSTHDIDTVNRIWPHCSFTSAEDAARRFAAAYPHAPADPHLAEYNTEIEHEAAAAD